MQIQGHIELHAGEPRLSETAVEPVPIRSTPISVEAENCGPQVQSPERSVSYSDALWDTTTFANAISTASTKLYTRSISGQIDIKMNDYVTGRLGGGYSDTRSVTKTISVTDATTKSVEKRVSETIRVPLRVEPGTRTTAIMTASVWEAHTHFQVPVVVDADLSANEEGLSRVSDVLHESERTFFITGTFESQQNYQSEARFDAVLIDCTSGDRSE